MRRISMQYAQPGMVLGVAIFDNYGNLLLEKGTRLTLDNVAALGRLGGGEMFFDDRRVDDVPVTPLIPARIEGDAARKVHELLAETKKVLADGNGQKRIDINPLEKAAYNMVEQLFPVVLGEVNASGCFSLRDYNQVHPVQVTALAVLMGRQAGVAEADLARLGLATLIQNIGYVALVGGMMDEPAALTELETHEVHQHAQYGYQILVDHTTAPADVTQTVLEHHERYDGSGYPRGLKGDAIGIFARLIAITDSYYSLVSRRPHRQSHLPHEAIEFIMAYSGELFDPDLVRLFTRLMPLYPTGVMVNLNTGEMGIVSDARAGLIGRPTIRICYDKHLKELSRPFDMDLADSEHQHRLVTGVVEY